MSPSAAIHWNDGKWKLHTALHQSKVYLRDHSLYNLNSTMTYPSFETFESTGFIVTDELAWSFWLLFILEVKLGYICSDVLRILLNVNRWVKQIQNIDNQCKTISFSYFTQVWFNINIMFYWICKGKQLNIPL